MVSLQVQTSWLLLYETLKLRRQQKQTNTQMQEKQGFLQFGSHCNINPSLSPKSPRRRENEHGLWKLNYHALAIKHLISSAKTTFNLHCASKHYTSLDQTRPIRQLFPNTFFQFMPKLIQIDPTKADGGCLHTHFTSKQMANLIEHTGLKDRENYIVVLSH